MNIKVILNPESGDGRGIRIWKAIEQELNQSKQKGYSWSVSLAEGPEKTRDTTARAKRDGFDAVMVIGGDGTVGDVAWGSLDDPIPLLIVPGGTGNASARSLQLDASAHRVVSTLNAGRVQTIDAGMIGSELFLNMAGIGFDSAVLDQYKRRRHFRGIPGYMAIGLSMLSGYRPAHLTVTVDGKNTTYESVMMSICNGPYYGGGLMMAPHARMDDGLLDVCILKDLTPRDFLTIWRDMYQGRHIHHPKIKVLKAASFSIESDPPLLFHRDGEVMGVTPCQIHVLPQAVKVLVPEGREQ
jgi:diacylglycerol kinase (ATP)